MSSSNSSGTSASGLWWRELNRYHWFVFALASFGWMFDCLRPADFYHVAGRLRCATSCPPPSLCAQIKFGTWATSIFIWLGHWRVDLRKKGRSMGARENDGP